MNALPEEILRCFRKDFTEHLSYEELQHLKRLKNSFEKKDKVEKISNDFMAFVKEMWPEFIEGKHHKEKTKGCTGRVKRKSRAPDWPCRTRGLCLRRNG